MPFRKILLIGLLAFLTTNVSLAGKPLEHPAPGTTLVRFAELDPGVYKGSKPKSDADFRFLQSKRIKYIVQVRFLPFLSGKEEKQARAYGVTLISVPMNASTFQPSEKHVDKILALLHDPCHQPIYVHCDIGRDRTSLVATLYKLYFDRLPKQDAFQTMLDFGFSNQWTLTGLKRYLNDHLTEPASLTSLVPSCRGAVAEENTRKVSDR